MHPLGLWTAVICKSEDGTPHSPRSLFMWRDGCRTWHLCSVRLRARDAYVQSVLQKWFAEVGSYFSESLTRPFLLIIIPRSQLCSVSGSCGQNSEKHTRAMQLLCEPLKVASLFPLHYRKSYLAAILMISRQDSCLELLRWGH